MWIHQPALIDSKAALTFYFILLFSIFCFVDNKAAVIFYFPLYIFRSCLLPIQSQMRLRQEIRNHCQKMLLPIGFVILINSQSFGLKQFGPSHLRPPYSYAALARKPWIIVFIHSVKDIFLQTLYHGSQSLECIVLRSGIYHDWIGRRGRMVFKVSRFQGPKCFSRILLQLAFQLHVVARQVVKSFHEQTLKQVLGSHKNDNVFKNSLFHWFSYSGKLVVFTCSDKINSFQPLVLITSSTFLLIMAKANDLRGPALYLWARLSRQKVLELPFQNFIKKYIKFWRYWSKGLRISTALDF